jgi:hypothetical protein
MPQLSSRTWPQLNFFACSAAFGMPEMKLLASAAHNDKLPAS